MGSSKSDILEVLRDRAARKLELDADKEVMARAVDEIERLRRVLQQFADNQLSDDNCASVEVAAKRVRSLARTALRAHC